MTDEIWILFAVAVAFGGWFFEHNTGTYTGTECAKVCAPFTVEAFRPTPRALSMDCKCDTKRPTPEAKP